MHIELTETIHTLDGVDVYLYKLIVNGQLLGSKVSTARRSPRNLLGYDFKDELDRCLSENFRVNPQL